MAYKPESGHQLACKVIDLEGVRSRLMADIRKSKFFPDPGLGSTRKTRAVKAVEKYIQENIQKTTIWYGREASILAGLSHVG